VVGHAYNPSYSEGRGRRISSSKIAVKTVSKTKENKEKGLGTGLKW
jgi:hypothetical protein